MKKQTALRFLYLFFVFAFFLHTHDVFAATPTVQSEEVLEYTNAERKKVGRPPLVSNDKLSNVAREKMLDLFARQYFAHESPSGESVSDLAKKAGYAYIVVGENLAMGSFRSSKAVVDAWMDSPGHKKNILSESYSEIGIAAGRGMYEGNTIWMVVQSFGYPSSKCPAVDPALTKKLAVYDSKLTLLAKIAEKRKNAISLTSGTLEERRARVDSYNLSARFYNSVVEEYKEYVAMYNKKVTKHNTCVQRITSKMD